MITKVENIDQFNRYFNQPTHHPLVSVANLADAHLSLFNPTDFGMYCVVLMDTEFGELTLRDSRMHYQSGTIFTMKPGHIVSMNLNSGARPRGWMLAFRPELIVNSGLGRDFYMFNFFDYEVAEALKLYEGERRIILNCFNNILSELRAPDDEFTSNMVRLGIGHYGITSVPTQKLEEVCTLKTNILQIKHVPADETVGYSRKGVLNRDSVIGAIPIGYADGLDRHLGNGVGKVLVNGKRAPIVGNVCMDVCMIDLTGINAEEGDEVTIFGNGLSINEVAQWLGTIPYEVLTSISRRVRRIYYKE